VYHSINESPQIFDDFLAKQLITEEEYESIGTKLADGVNFFVPDKAALCKEKESAIRMVVQNQIAPISLPRSKYTEDMLINSIKLGVKQYVLHCACQ
jgi:O-methyltransferase involved in polyketide biosynthesis